MEERVFNQQSAFDRLRNPASVVVAANERVVKKVSILSADCRRKSGELKKLPILVCRGIEDGTNAPSICLPADNLLLLNFLLLCRDAL